MFAGIGGFRSGLERIGGFSCVVFCEIDKYAQRAYRALYNTEKEYFCNDATKINTAELPDIDLMKERKTVMPNHITNILNLQGDDEQIKKVLEAIKVDEIGIGTIDFNKIILMPESLNIESGTQTERGLKLYHDFIVSSQAVATQGLFATPEDHEKAVNKHIAKFQKIKEDDPETWKLGETAYNNIQKYGHADWYDWSVVNWGTKWNSYGYDDLPEYKDKNNTIIFETAWSNPTPVIDRLSEMYPDVGFSHRWADEDFGYNCGEREYERGERLSENIPTRGSKEAYELAADVMNLDLAEEGYQLSEDGSTYEYQEDDEEMGEMKL